MTEPVPSMVTAPAMVVADSMPLRRAAMAHLLRGWADHQHLTIVERAANDDTRTADDAVCLLVLNVGNSRVEEMLGQDWVTRVRSRHADAPLVVVSDRERPDDAVQAFAGGARAFIPTSAAPEAVLEILSFVLRGGSYFPPAALRGGPRPEHGDNGIAAVQASDRPGEDVDPLTSRQQQVLTLLRRGFSNKLIARELKMCEATVKVHVRQIMRRLRVANRTQAALWGMASPDTRAATLAGDWPTEATTH